MYLENNWTFIYLFIYLALEMCPEEATTSASGNHHQVQLQLEISEVVWEVIFLTIWIRTLKHWCISLPQTWQNKLICSPGYVPPKKVAHFSSADEVSYGVWALHEWGISQAIREGWCYTSISCPWCHLVKKAVSFSKTRAKGHLDLHMPPLLFNTKQCI